MKHEITDSIYTKKIYELICIDYVSFGFTHLSITLEKPRMSKYLFRKWKIKCHQHDRPINRMETQYVFTDQMQICRPQFVELFGTFTVAVISDSCDIVCQSIQPYINNVFRIEVYRNTPFEGSSGYAEILKSRKKEVVHHLVFT